MITPRVELGTAPLFRKEFALDAGHGAGRSARLAISSLGVFEARLNGARRRRRAQPRLERVRVAAPLPHVRRRPTCSRTPRC